MPEEQDKPLLEQRGLWMSILGALFMAALGIGFAILTSSDAVLLDGLFSLVGSVVGVIALRVATLVMQPGDDRFHFGYAAYEPMLNLTKGLLMAFITLFALVSAIMTLVHGGRAVQAGWASIYAAIAAAGCLAIAASQWKLAVKTHSPLLSVDAKNWLVDGILSLAVLVAFVGTFLLAGTKFAHWLPYADPVVVIVLVALSLPIPAQIIRENWNQMVGKAPEAAFQERAKTAVSSAFGDADDVETEIRMQQIGRLTYVQLYVVCGNEVEATLQQLDECRRSVEDSLTSEFGHLAFDVIFTRDAHWVAASVGTSDTEASGQQTGKQAIDVELESADEVDPAPEKTSES